MRSNRPAKFLATTDPACWHHRGSLGPEGRCDPGSPYTRLRRLSSASTATTPARAGWRSSKCAVCRRGSAGVQHPLARLRDRAGRRPAGRHRPTPSGHPARSRAAWSRRRALQQDAIFPFHTGHRRDARSLMRASVTSRLWRWLLLPDPHGRALVVGLHDEPPVIGIGLTQALGEAIRDGRGGRAGDAVDA